MAAADDDLKTVEDRLWALLLARAEFTDLVKIGNRIKATAANRQRTLDPRPAKLPADFPEVSIDRGRFRRNPYRATIVFGTMDTEACPRIEDISQDFVITVLADAQGTNVTSEVWAEVQAAIDAGGPRLGIPDVVKLIEEYNGTSEITSAGKAKGTPRRVVTVTVRVAMRKSVTA